MGLPRWQRTLYNQSHMTPYQTIWLLEKPIQTLNRYFGVANHPVIACKRRYSTTLVFSNTPPRWRDQHTTQVIYTKQIDLLNNESYSRYSKRSEQPKDIRISTHIRVSSTIQTTNNIRTVEDMWTTQTYTQTYTMVLQVGAISKVTEKLDHAILLEPN